MLLRKKVNKPVCRSYRHVGPRYPIDYFIAQAGATTDKQITVSGTETSATRKPTEYFCLISSDDQLEAQQQTWVAYVISHLYDISSAS